MNKPVIIFGAKGIGKAALEIFKSNGIVVYGLLDDSSDLHGTEIDDVPVLGKTDDHGFIKLIGQKCDAFVATDDPSLRKRQVKMLMEQRKVMPANAVHKTAILSGTTGIGHGNFISAGVILGPDVVIGQHCLIHSGAVVEHTTKIGDYTQIGAGAIINSGVEIGEEVFIGSRCTIVSGVKIGKKARIGAGSVVIADVNQGETVFGNPAIPVEK